MFFFLILFFVIVYFFINFLLGRIRINPDFVRTKGFAKGFYNDTVRPKDFETSLLVLASVVIKADGVINQTELDYVRNYFATTYGKERANKAFRNFREVIQQNISIRKTCTEIAKFMPNPARVQLIKFLFNVAYSDGQITQSEELEIRKIASYMYVGHQDYLYLYQMFFQSQQASYSSAYSKNSNYEFEVLGLSESATNDQVKKAYRQLVKKYHPDRLQDVSSQDLAVAKQKFQKIQTAYEAIKELRGF